VQPRAWGDDVVRCIAEHYRSSLYGYDATTKRPGHSGLQCGGGVGCAHACAWEHMHACGVVCIALIAVSGMNEYILWPDPRHHIRMLILCTSGELVLVLHWSLINYSAIVKILKVCLLNAITNSCMAVDCSAHLLWYDDLHAAQYTCGAS